MTVVAQSVREYQKEKKEKKRKRRVKISFGCRCDKSSSHCTHRLFTGLHWSEQKEHQQYQEQTTLSSKISLEIDASQSAQSCLLSQCLGQLIS